MFCSLFFFSLSAARWMHLMLGIKEASVLNKINRTSCRGNVQQSFSPSCRVQMWFQNRQNDRPQSSAQTCDCTFNSPSAEMMLNSPDDVFMRDQFSPPQILFNESILYCRCFAPNSTYKALFIRKKNKWVSNWRETHFRSLIQRTSRVYEVPDCSRSLKTASQALNNAENSLYYCLMHTTVG